MSDTGHLDENGFVVLDDEPERPEHLTPTAIAACGLCDELGYRETVVCDHLEHSSAEARQAAREAVRVALAKAHTTDTPKVSPEPAQPQHGAGER